MIFKKSAAPAKNKVSFMIVGAQKSGTTSLHYYLNQIPGILGSEPKETDFFSYKGLYKKGYDFYSKHFFKAQYQDNLLFDASVEYMYLPYVAKRLYKYNPSLKLIFCLREPVKRAISAYQMYKYINSAEGKYWRQNYLYHLQNHSSKYNRIGKKFYCQSPFPDFENMIQIEIETLNEDFNHRIYEPSLIKRGFYKSQIENLMRFFPADQFFFVNSKSLKQNPGNEVSRILEFLRFDADISNINFSQKLSGISDGTFTVNNKCLNILRDIFQSRNQGLDSIVGFNFSE